MSYTKYQTVDKIRLKFDAILEPDSFWNGKTVLDVGCNEGLLYPLLSKRGANYIGIDNSIDYISMAKQNFPEADFRLMDLRNWNNPVDIVVSLSTFHIFNDKEFDKIIGHYSKVCKTLILECPVKGVSSIYYTRSDLIIAEVVLKYFKDIYCYGISPSPHDIQSVRKVFKCTN